MACKSSHCLTLLPHWSFRVVSVAVRTRRRCTEFPRKLIVAITYHPPDSNQWKIKLHNKRKVYHLLLFLSIHNTIFSSQNVYHQFLNNNTIDSSSSSSILFNFTRLFIISISNIQLPCLHRHLILPTKFKFPNNFKNPSLFTCQHHHTQHFLHLPHTPIQFPQWLKRNLPLPGRRYSLHMPQLRNRRSK